MADRSVTIKLNLKPENTDVARRAFRQLGKDLDTEASKARKNMILAGTPDFVRQRAGMEFRGEKAAGALSKAVSAEKLGLANIDKFGATLGPVITNVGLGLAKLGPYGMAAAAGLAVTVGSVAALGAAAIKFGGAADPALLARFSLAMNDVQAVIGRAFVPILRQMEKGVRLVGDAIASMLPSTEEFEAVFRELEPIWQELRAALADIAPLVKSFLVVNLRAAAVAMRMFVESLKPLMLMARILVPGFGRGGGLESSVGASLTGPPAFMGAEAIGQSNILAAFAAGTADPARETAANTARTNDLLGALLGVMNPIGSAAGILRGLTG